MPGYRRPCPICSFTEAQLCLENPMAAVGGFDMSYSVVRCSFCGFHYAQDCRLPTLSVRITSQYLSTTCRSR